MLTDVRVGDEVGVPFGGAVRTGRVVEDRGGLAPGGERVLRVRLFMPSDEEFEVELPVSYLVIPVERAVHHPLKSAHDRERFIAELAIFPLEHLLELEEALESRVALPVRTKTSEPIQFEHVDLERDLADEWKLEQVRQAIRARQRGL